MAEDKKLIPFRLVNIEEKQFAVFKEALESENPIHEQIGTGFGVDPAEKIISSSILYFLKKGEDPFIKMELTCYFEIKEQPFKRQILEENKVRIPLGLARHLAMITSGAIRGALFAKTQNTPFAQYPMRLINLTKVLKEDIIIKLEEEQ